MKERKFWAQLTMGDKIELGELDYNNITYRIHTGRTNGYYTQRDQLGPEFFGQFAMKYLVRVWADGPENKDMTIKRVDVSKRTAPEVGEGDEPKNEKTKCPHDWQDPTTWQHVTTLVGGNNRYFKQCVLGCGAKSPLIKKREVELAQEQIGETLDTVPVVE